MGSDESHFIVSVGSDGQTHKTLSANPNLSEDKGEPKRYRTEVLPLTSLTPYRQAKPAHKASSEEAEEIAVGRWFRSETAQGKEEGLRGQFFLNLFLVCNLCAPLILGSEWRKKLAGFMSAKAVGDFAEHSQAVLSSSFFKTCPLQMFQHGYV